MLNRLYFPLTVLYASAVNTSQLYFQVSEV